MSGIRVFKCEEAEEHHKLEKPNGEIRRSNWSQGEFPIGDASE